MKELTAIELIYEVAGELEDRGELPQARFLIGAIDAMYGDTEAPEWPDDPVYMDAFNAGRKHHVLEVIEPGVLHADIYPTRQFRVAGSTGHGVWSPRIGSWTLTCRDQKVIAQAPRVGPRWDRIEETYIAAMKTLRGQLRKARRS